MAAIKIKAKVRGKLGKSGRGKGNVAENLTAAGKICWRAKLLRPAANGKAVDWSFLLLPAEASAKLPSRGMVSVEGTFDGVGFHANLEPDGRGGHWLKVGKKLRAAAGAKVGDTVLLEIAPMKEVLEPRVPADLRKALAAADPRVRAVWADITPTARRDWIQWIDSAIQESTRLKRIANGCDMMAKGKRRPCCFDRSGMYSRSPSCPAAMDET